MVDSDFTSLDFSGDTFKVKVGDQEYEGKSVILATGADTKWLGVPGEAEKIGRGVSSCAPCDAAFFRDRNVIVVGGGDSAMEEATVLANFATSVTVVYRGDTLKASKAMQQKAMENPKIKFIYNTEVTEILGELKVEKVKVKNNKTGEESEMPIDGVFVAIGHIPNTKLFQGVIDLDEVGYIKAYDHFKTNIKGVYTAGDVHDTHYRQAITAAGYGSAAALEVEKYLRETS